MLLYMLQRLLSNSMWVRKTDIVLQGRLGQGIRIAIRIEHSQGSIPGMYDSPSPLSSVLRAVFCFLKQRGPVFSGPNNQTSMYLGL